MGSVALQAAGGRCASGGARSGPSLTDPARLSVASKLPPVSAVRSDHLSFPSALLAGRARFRLLLSTTSCWVRHRACPDAQALRPRAFTPAAFHFLLSVPPKEGDTAVPLAFCLLPLAISFRFPLRLLIGQIIPSGLTPIPYHFSHSTSYTMNSR